ncbi:MAG: trehalose-phosphatase [Gemmatimonadaceae bacterium]
MTALLVPVADAVAARLAGAPLLVMLDVDGTLAPIAPRPDAARVPEETRRIVAALASRPAVDVVLVSGRAAGDARRLVSVANVWVIGNHGYEVVGPDGGEIIDPKYAAMPAAIALASRRLRSRLSAIPGVILEDKRWTLSVHYRLADASVEPALRSIVEETARALGLRVSAGKMVFEVRPPARVDKGSAVLALASTLGGFGGDASIVFAGDDATDEDAFRALRAHSPAPVTIRVGQPDGITAAELTAHDTDEIREFLAWLLSTRAPAQEMTGAP